MGMSIDLVVVLALAMIVILASVMVYELGADQLTEFFQGNVDLSFGGGE